MVHGSRWWVVVVCALLVLTTGTFALDNGLGLTPQMGWNTWNKFACSISEDLVKKEAEAIASAGLHKLGYNHILLDDCWQAMERNSSGFIVADPQRFPSGLASLADWLHQKGFKFGVYSDAGLKTCQGRPGSLGYEQIDASTYASWGVDYLKYDNCFNQDIPPAMRYPVMRDALNATGRRIFYSMCEWGEDDVASWATSVGNSWRTTMDISDKWDSMLANIYLNDQWWGFAQPGGWNDPDMLEVGNGGMSNAEYRTHMSLWALAKAPLILGNDIASMDSDTKMLVSNPRVIAINQDAMGQQGSYRHTPQSHKGLHVWAGPLASKSPASDAYLAWFQAQFPSQEQRRALGRKLERNLRESRGTPWLPGRAGEVVSKMWRKMGKSHMQKRADMSEPFASLGTSTAAPWSGTVVAAAVNLETQALPVVVKFIDIQSPPAPQYRVFDVWANKDLGVFDGGGAFGPGDGGNVTVVVQPHDTVLLMVHPVLPSGA